MAERCDRSLRPQLYCSHQIAGETWQNALCCRCRVLSPSVTAPRYVLDYADVM